MVDLEPRLYILMRTDMDSMNPGKAMAQACHAQALFSEDMFAVYQLFGDENDPATDEVLNKFQRWRDGGPGFGTTITLAVDNEEQLNYYVENVDSISAGVVLDPTYPVRDGLVTHLIPVTTCGWIFTDNPSGVSDLNLHA